MFCFVSTSLLFTLAIFSLPLLFLHMPHVASPRSGWAGVAAVQAVCGDVMRRLGYRRVDSATQLTDWAVGLLEPTPDVILGNNVPET